MLLTVSRLSRASWIAIAGMLCLDERSASADASASTESRATVVGCLRDDSGLTLPAGFCASVFADEIGHARHLVVSPAGVVYVNTWLGRNEAPADAPSGGFLVALQDTRGTGTADVRRRFGASAHDGTRGGTGIAWYDGALYAESRDTIVRYRMSPGAAVPSGPPETIVAGLPLGGDHPMHPFAIDPGGSLYVDVASATNSCQLKNRTLQSPGANPCTELKTRGGIWRFAANQTDQVFSPNLRFATGIRNGEGIAIDTAGHRIFVSQHGRDQLYGNWPNLYAPEQEATLPAEEVLLLTKDGDYGWPACYYDPGRKQLVLAPEYGGDGGNAVGRCASKRAPLAAYPAHWAPNDLLFYDKQQFPAHYRQGLFIAFHGSWDRAPYAQQGYNVVFQPLEGGTAAGPCEVFADGFAGSVKSPGSAAHRPSGLAVGSDGALYVSDDVRGRIYRIVYTGVTPGAGRPAAGVPSVTVPGERVYPDSITATADGRIIIGSIGARAIFSAAPGAATADAWIVPDSDRSLGVYGVLADEKSGTLWACYSAVPGAPVATQSRSALKAFDLRSGKFEASYELPAEGAQCNDIATGAGESIYVTDGANMEIDRLQGRDQQLQLWSGDGDLGPKGGILDGIAVVGERVIVDTRQTGKLLSVAIGSDGDPGSITEISLGRPLDHPQGMRTFGQNQVLLVESGGAGRLVRLNFGHDAASITTIKEGYPDGPVSVAVVGSKGYVLEGQLAALIGRTQPNDAPRPFHATAVDLPL